MERLLEQLRQDGACLLEGCTLTEQLTAVATEEMVERAWEWLEPQFRKCAHELAAAYGCGDFAREHLEEYRQELHDLLWRYVGEKIFPPNAMEPGGMICHALLNRVCREFEQNCRQAAPHGYVVTEESLHWVEKALTSLLNVRPYGTWYFTQLLTGGCGPEEYEEILEEGKERAMALAREQIGQEFRDLKDWYQQCWRIAKEAWNWMMNQAGEVVENVCIPRWETELQDYLESMSEEAVAELVRRADEMFYASEEARDVAIEWTQKVVQRYERLKMPVAAECLRRVQPVVVRQVMQAWHPRRKQGGPGPEQQVEMLPEPEQYMGLWIDVAWDRCMKYFVKDMIWAIWAD